MNAKELMQKIVEQKITHDHHASDLYVPVTVEVMELLSEYDHRKQITTFTGPYGKLWYDVPFAYVPFFEERAASHVG